MSTPSLPPFSSSPNFTKQHLLPSSNSTTNNNHHQHKPYFHTAPFGTLILCADRNCNWSLPAIKFVNCHISSSVPLMSLITSSSQDNAAEASVLLSSYAVTTPPLPVLIYEPCVTSMMKTISANNGSVFAAATAREKFVRLRLSVSKRSYFECDEEGDDDDAARRTLSYDKENDQFTLILWCVDPALAITEFLNAFFDENISSELKSKSCFLKRKTELSSRLFSDGDPVEASSSTYSLIGFPLECYQELLSELNNALKVNNIITPTSSLSVTSEDDDQTSPGVLAWMIDPVSSSTLENFGQRNNNRLQNRLRRAELEKYLSSEILSCSCCHQKESSKHKNASSSSSSSSCCEFCFTPLWRKILPHQKKAVLFGLQTKFKCLLGDSMGCGKTLEALALLRLMKLEKAKHEDDSKMNHLPLKVIIVCPATARIHWADSIEKWLGSSGCCFSSTSNEEVHIVADSATAPKDDVQEESDGSTQADEHQHHQSTKEKKDYDITITSFSMLVRLFSSHFATRDYDLVIIDESHIIRASSLGTSRNQHDDFLSSLSSQQALCCAKLCRGKGSNGVLLLSGTPLLSKPFDCWAQVELLRPGLLGSSSQEFASNYLALQFQPFIQPGACHRSEELNLLLLNGEDADSSSSVIVRTEKAEALKNLVPLKRTLWRLDVVSTKMNNDNISDDSDDSSGTDGDDSNGGSSSPPSTSDDDDAENDASSLTQSSSRRANKSTNLRSSHQRKYQQAGLAKVEAAFQKCISELVEPHRATEASASAEEESSSSAVQPTTTTLRIVLFAHHVAVLDKLALLVRKLHQEEQQSLSKASSSSAAIITPHQKRKLDISLVRIDGSVLPDDRHRQIQKFHQDEDGYKDDNPRSLQSEDNNFDEASSLPPPLRVKFAIVSITAAGVAISLHKATCAVFIELPIDATWLRQCEDRLHRMSNSGNSDCGACHDDETQSYLCIGRCSVFDAKHVGQLFNSLESVNRVYDDYSHIIRNEDDDENVSSSQQQEQHSSKFFHNNNNNNDKRALLSSSHQEEVSQELLITEISHLLHFQVSLPTSRLHIFIAGGGAVETQHYRHVFSCAFDEAYISSTFNLSSTMKLRRELENSNNNIRSINNFEHTLSSLSCEFISLWKRHLKPPSRRIAPPLTLYDLKKKIAESHDGYVNLIVSEESLLMNKINDESSRGIFERYLGQRLSEEEKSSWKGSSSELNNRRLVVTLVYNRTVMTTIALSAKPNQRIKKQKQAKKATKIDLLVEYDSSSVSARLFCLYCQTALSTQAASNPARFSLLGKLLSELDKIDDAKQNDQTIDDQEIEIDATSIEASEWIPFCSGECRNCWIMKRGARGGDASSSTTRSSGVAASSRLRSSVLKLEKGVCSGCNLDTQDLVRKLAALQKTENRLDLLKNEYPVLFTVSGGHSAAVRLCRKPVEGNIWHADHEVPVFRGGGASVHSEGNLQTLCVACHLAKSSYERSSAAAMRRCEIRGDTEDDDKGKTVPKKESGERRVRS